MGISGLWSWSRETVPTAFEHKYLGDLNGSRVAIDGGMLLTISLKKCISFDEYETWIAIFLDDILQRLQKIINYSIDIIVVMDGDAHPLKKQTLETRRSTREKAEKKIEIAENDIDKLKCLKASARVTADIRKRALEMFTAHDIKFIIADDEGEAECAKLARNGQVDFVFTDDSDALPLGTPLVVRNALFDTLDDAVCIVKTKTILEKLKLSSTELINLCILVGTDFNQGGIKGLGCKKSYKKIIAGDYDKMLAGVDNLHEIRHFFSGWTITDLDLDYFQYTINEEIISKRRIIML